MMRNINTVMLVPAIAVLVAVCCNKTDGVCRELDSLEKRIVTLEEAVTDVNDNAVSIQNITDDNIIITSFEEIDHGYEMSLNNGKTIKVVYGKDAPGVVPIIGVDADGRWIQSVDGGKTFSVLEKSVGAFDNYGVTPEISTDKDGYWTVSVDGGKTWKQITGGNGSPISATDGREVAGQYAFFTNVSADAAQGKMSFLLATGRTLDVPIGSGSDVIVSGYAPKDKIFNGATVKYDVRLVDVASAAWLVVPDGWEAKLDRTTMTITAPEEAEEGEYSFTLATVSGKGLSRQFDYTFVYEDCILFDDFEKGDIPDKRYWALPPRKYSSGWTMYMPETYDNTYLKDGKLVLKAEKVDGQYKSAGLVTNFGFEKCRVELSAKFTKMVTSGINSAAWLFPYSRMVWPHGGEVDIFEHLNDADAVWQTCHTHYSVDLGGDPDDKHKKVSIDPTRFNTYTIDLTEEAVIFYINGKETFRYADKHLPNEAEVLQYPFYDGDFYLLLDCCLGTEWPGPIVDEDLPGIMEVDWVKISKLD